MSDTPHRPFVYIVLLNWNGWQDTLKCLSSLTSLNYPAYQVVVVDNGSNDDSVLHLLKANPNLVLLEAGKNLGFSGGNNIGISYALQHGADYVLLLNNDTIVDGDFLLPLIEVMEEDEQVAAVNPKIYFLEEKEKKRLWGVGGQTKMWSASIGNRGRDQIDKGQFEKLETVDFGSGCCLLMRRRSLEQIGLLNEAYFAYYEDVDWSYRARHQGYKIVYVPQSRIWHSVGAASKSQPLSSRQGSQNPFIHYLAARNHLWILRRYVHGWQRLTSFPAYFFRRILFYSFAFVLLGRTNKLKELWRGFLVGMGKLPGDCNSNQVSTFQKRCKCQWGVEA